MKYLLDTSVIIDHLRGKKALVPDYLGAGSIISVITQAELFYGAYKSERPKHNLSKIKQMFADLKIEIQPLEEEVLDEYGQLKARLEKKGRRLDEFDLLIASTALSLNLTLVTRNTKHFSRIPRLRLTTP
jgi:predicted nucleic acid-binding protein